MKKVILRALFGVFFVIIGIISAADTPEWVQKVLEKHAPVVYFHPRELYFPLAVENFIQNSALYSNSGELVVSRGDLTGARLAEFSGPEYAQYRLSPDPKVYPGNEPVQGVVRAPVYAHWVRTGDNTGVAQYWFNSGYNGPLTVPGLGSVMRILGVGVHEADKEHVAVHLEKKPGSRRDDLTAWVVREVFFSRHEACKHGGYVPHAQCEKTSDGRIQVYAARNNHASYPHPYPIDLLFDQMSSRGPVWDTAECAVNTGVLKALSPGCEWLKFPGAWGKDPAPHTESFQGKWRERADQTCSIAEITVPRGGSPVFSLCECVPTRIRTVQFSMPVGVTCTIFHRSTCGCHPIYENAQNGSEFPVSPVQDNLVITGVTGTVDPVIVRIMGIETK